jgi:thymidylate synthase
MARATKLEPGEFVHSFGDVHLYANHFEQARLQLQRQPRSLPRLELNPSKSDLFGWDYEDFTLHDYAPDSHIKAPVAV